MADMNTIKAISNQYKNDKNIFLAGMDNNELKKSSYIMIVRMLDIIINLCCRDLQSKPSIEQYLSELTEAFPYIAALRAEYDEEGRFLKFYPRAMPVDNDRKLIELYEIQISV